MKGIPVWINGRRSPSVKSAAAALSLSLGRKVNNLYLFRKLKSGEGRFVIGGVEVSESPPEKVWVNGVECGFEEGAEKLGALLGEEISVDWIASLLKDCERVVVRGVEIASYPTAEDRGLGSGAAAKTRRRALLNRNALDYGLSKPSWFA